MISMSRWRVGAEAGARRDAVLVDDAQVAEAHVRRVVVVGEREAVVGLQPAVVGHGRGQPTLRNVISRRPPSWMS